MNTLDNIKKHLDIETDKNTSHTYTGVYHDLFKDIRLKKMNVLEIGILSGGSLVLWDEYFPYSTIFGIDIKFDLVQYGQDRPSINFIKGNAYDEQTIETFKVNNILFDIIIDDGPHTLESQILCAEKYSQLLTENGIMVIEDVPSLEAAFTICNNFPKDTNKKYHIIDLRYCKGRFDDIMIIFK